MSPTGDFRKKNYKLSLNLRTIWRIGAPLQTTFTRIVTKAVLDFFICAAQILFVCYYRTSHNVFVLCLLYVFFEKNHLRLTCDVEVAPVVPKF